MVHIPLIGILVPTRKMRKRVLKLYQRHNELTLKLFAFARADILWQSHKMIGLCLIGGRWKEKMFHFPHVVYNQCYNKKTSTIEQIRNVIGRDKFFNSVNWLNKWDVHNLLSQTNLKVYLPDTFLFNEVNVSDLIKAYKQVYIKPCYGNHGNSVHRLERKENGDIHISLHSLAPRVICRKNEDMQQKLANILGANSHIVQKGIQSSQIDNKRYDIRVLVQKDSRGKWMVSAMVCRVAHELYFNTSVYESIHDAEVLFSRILPIETKETTLTSLRQISVDAAQVLDTHIGLLGELSVDFLLDEEMKLWIIEINGKPQKGIYKDINSFKYEQLIYRRPMEYAHFLSTHK